MGSCLSYVQTQTTTQTNTQEVDKNLSIPDGLKRKGLPKYTPQITSGRVVDVYDGDTMTLAARVPGDNTIYQFQLRLHGLDCAEMKTKNPSEKLVAIKAKEYVESCVLNKIVNLENVALDKYGRLLANVKYGEHNLDLGEGLLVGRMAVEYDGGTKICPTNWMEYYASGTM